MQMYRVWAARGSVAVCINSQWPLPADIAAELACHWTAAGYAVRIEHAGVIA